MFLEGRRPDNNIIQIRKIVCRSQFTARLINLVKLAGPLVSPNGLTLHWNCLRWVENAVLGLSNTQTPNPDRRTISHHSAPPRHHRSSVTVWHLSMYKNSVCGNPCPYGNFHHVSLLKQPDCSGGSVTLQLYHSLAARPGVDL